MFNQDDEDAMGVQYKGMAHGEMMVVDGVTHSFIYWR
jgi:hypothetical protein